ncbi:MAG: hypothetical protein E3J86_02280 [Candidatus Thorarchaeota archaeon]|nr:MAG: hypothetical protein E3J86_02280 [Candidatus Thorarchaeota archaeon]
MKRFTPDSTVMVTTQEIEIISHEKAYVRLEAGCVWSYLLEDGARIGVAFSGPSRFAVDAIAETKIGAIGESVTGTLVGVQLFIGPSSLENISKSADNSDLQNQEYSNADAFTKAVDSTIEDLVNNKDTKTRFDIKKETWIFFGKDSSEKKIILVLSEKKGLVFIYGKLVHVVGDDNLVSVSKSGVVVSNSDGKQLIVNKDGIIGLDSCVDIGPIVTRSVSGVMKGLKSLKSMKYAMSSFPAYESVDDFDWKD